MHLFNNVKMVDGFVHYTVGINLAMAWFSML